MGRNVENVKKAIKPLNRTQETNSKTWTKQSKDVGSNLMGCDTGLYSFIQNLYCNLASALIQIVYNAMRSPTCGLQQFDL